MAAKEEPPNIVDPGFSYETSPHLFLFTSLTAGSSHIITATSRMETILKANRVPFYAIDTATDEKARRIWTRRSKGRTIPGLVKQGIILGDLEQVEEWNEFGEIKDVLGVKKKKKKAAPQADISQSTPKDTAGEGLQELKTGDAPIAPEMPKDLNKELPSRAKPHESPKTSTQESPKAGGQSSLAAEVAAAAQKRAKDKAAALRASVEAKQRQTAEAAEIAEEKGGTPEKAVVDDALEAGPAGDANTGSETNISGPEAVTDNPMGFKKEIELAESTNQVTRSDSKMQESEKPKVGGSVQDAKPSEKNAEAVLDAEPVEGELDAAPAIKSGEGATSNMMIDKSDHNMDANGSVDRHVEQLKPNPDHKLVEKSLNAAPSDGNSADATASLSPPPKESEADRDATSTVHQAVTQRDEEAADEPHDAASGKDGQMMVSGSEAEDKPTPREEVEAQFDPGTASIEATETGQGKAPAKANGINVPADTQTVKVAEKENVLPEEPGAGNEVQEEELRITKEPKEQALDAQKATETVGD
ncbi:MAG: hypothetical protein Q9162_002840 [Coniocarpon cinnabarinum]